jgi:hypothetical protein
MAGREWATATGTPSLSRRARVSLPFTTTGDRRGCGCVEWFLLARMTASRGGTEGSIYVDAKGDLDRIAFGNRAIGTVRGKPFVLLPLISFLGHDFGDVAGGGRAGGNSPSARGPDRPPSLRRRVM